jgi:phosphatidylserine/phosphatidylglycerophosphate/cardiolipin synthase-like enzyme
LRVVLVLALLAAGLVGWRVAASRSEEPASPVLPAGQVGAAAADRLVIEPDAGLRPIDALLAGARHSLDLSIYELADPTAEAIVARDAQRGVAVRVVLDRRLEGRNDAAAAAYLRAHGAVVHWASSRFFVSHEKAFVVDRRVAVVMSLNLTSRYYPTTRDVAVVDRDPADVRAVESVFSADFADRPVRAPTGDDLVWSPDRSEPDVLALIDGARHSLLVESEELSAAPVIDALVAAARRGVAVGVVMTDDPEWHAGFDAIRGAGGRVWVLHGESPLYIHAKLLVADAGTPTARALVGSQNLSTTSLTRDRELGIVLTSGRLVARLGRLVEHDAATGTPWR